MMKTFSVKRSDSERYMMRKRDYGGYLWKKAIRFHYTIRYYTVFSKIANFTHHLSQELDDIGWL